MKTTGSCHCGAVHWTYSGDIKSGTTCNCTICRRYGVIWAYGHVGETVEVKAPTDGLNQYVWGDRSIAFNFCKSCGCVAFYQGTSPEPDGRTIVAVNLRLSEPETVAKIPLRRFEGLHSWKDMPRDGKTVGDMWF